MTAPARTVVDRLPKNGKGAGSDIVVEAGAAEATIRHWIEGDAFPRVVIDVAGSQILVGNGTVAPTTLAGGGGGGAPTGASYVTMVAESGLSAETTLANVIRRDVVANRGSFGNAGVLFGATDTLIGYRDSGAAWDPYFPVLDGSGHISPSVVSGIAESSVTGLVADLAAKLAAASNLSDLANAATARTNLGLGTAATQASGAFDAAGAAAAAQAASQPLDGDLTTLAGLTATTDNFIVSVASAWASRTPAQVKATLAIAESDVTNLTGDLGALQTQTALLAAQFAAQAASGLGYFVISGLALSPNATPTKLDMAAGQAQFNTAATVPAAQTAIATTIASMADATNPKWVAVELDSSSVVNFNQGTAAASPAFPTPTASRVVLGWLWIPANATNVDTLLTTNNGLAKLIDARVFAAGVPIPTTVTFSNADTTIAATTRYQVQTGTMSASRVATLPLANSVPTGTPVTLLDASGTVSLTNFLSLARAGADLINGAAGAIFMLQAYGSITVISDGVSKWTFPLGVILPVARGGTSVTTLLNHGLLLGAGTGAITALALDASTTKYLQSGGASAGPAWATINVTDIPTAAPLASPALTGTPAIAAATGTSLAVTGALTSSGATSGVGYAAGAGGSVTQITSRTTGVTLNNVCGKITLFSTTLAADTDVVFTLTNSAIAATDLLVFNVIGGAAIKGGYAINAIPAAGSAQIIVHNHTPTVTATEAPVIAFAVIKSVIT